MNYLLTIHAQRVIKERDIPLSIIERTLNNPAMIEPDKNDPDLEHRLGSIPEYNGKVLRIVLNKKVDPARIITVYFDRAMRGKL
jgi:hypothetical protein